MSSGGARSRSGPPPDPTALRRERDAGEWTFLPPGGRQGATPDWPLTGQTIHESELWEDLWRRPQAVMWERYGQDLEVALYTRRFSEAEELGSKVNLSTLVRQMSDSLGLTTPGMRANRWRILREEESAPPGGKPSGAGEEPGAPARRTSRSRLTVVPAPANGE